MYKEVVLKAFEKGEKEIPGKTTKTLISEHISAVLMNDFKTQISGRTLRNLFNDANSIGENKDISINSDYIKSLCNYLEFDDYNAFLTETSNGIKKKKQSDIFCTTALDNSISLPSCYFNGCNNLNNQPTTLDGLE